ncbi:putative HTH-type transcriptional regulator YxaF [Methyloligella halotolerans]|uniref:Putative HTH-type transcriptional regulator YxaF n=1 Tax=Methyloligella halotolerans TaxID=1177755 RepID=A0A1E2RW93_9HYPH|nr:TetR/AcrR family transcriptional regulator [Methyloligella halotolerans]ODA66497.1 putative HTH-type transcriptional regulator YxaF [Methyloligella halotolerans]
MTNATPVSHQLTPSPPRGQARRALLDAAIKLVRRQGWAATTVDELCSSAGVTKGAFFHHFPSKEALGVAAAKHWVEVIGPFFAEGGDTRLSDPLDRIFAYLDFRAEIAKAPLDVATCFAGTLVQEVFASSAPIRDACGATIRALVEPLTEDFRAAIESHGAPAGVTAESLAIYTHTVFQGGFVMAKAENDAAPLIDAIAQLKRYIALLFGRAHP